MTQCDAWRRQISPYLDGELVAEDRAAFEAHVQGCEECRHTLEEERKVVDALRGARPLYEAPPTLQQRVEGLLRARSPAGLPTRGWSAVAWAAVLVGLVLASALLWRRPASAPPRASSEFASLAADTHLRYARGQLPLEVQSDEPAEVSRWFSGRVPFHLTLPDYPVGPGERKFYRLSGGRLVSFRNDYAAYVAYRMDERPISLLVTSASVVQPSGGETVVSGSLTFHTESIAGLKVITWSDKGLTYALASDLVVAGERSCLVCHGAPEERSKIEGLLRRPGA